MTHEFRTPINAILSLSRLLLDGLDGELNDDQRTEVTFIRQSAESLSELVNDLLDLAKIEAGKTTVRREAFEVADLFAALRGMMRPILGSSPVDLIFEEPDRHPDPAHRPGEGRPGPAQLHLQRAEVHRARRGPGLGGDGRRDRPWSSRSPTPASASRPRTSDGSSTSIAQVDGPLQSRFKGTGLGLSLSRQLAALLGGDVSLTSRPGVGSTFRFRLPVEYPGPDRRPNIGSTPAGARS